MTNYYEILGVEKGSSLKEIRKAYFSKALVHHPDKGGDQTEFKKINRAYSVLSKSSEKLDHFLLNEESLLNSNRKFFAKLIDEELLLWKISEEEIEIRKLWNPFSNYRQKIFSLDSWENLNYLHEKSRETCKRLFQRKLHEESEKSYIDSVDHFLTTKNFDKCRIPEKLQNFSQKIKEIDKYDEKFHEKAGEIISEIIDYVKKIQEEERGEEFRKYKRHHNIKKKIITSFSLVTVFFYFFYLYYKNKKRNNNFKWKKIN